MKKLTIILSFGILLVACSQTKEVTSKNATDNISLATSATNTYWQQHVNYTMDIDVDAEKHQYSGVQKLVYTNNSPDALDRVFYHLYFNAFQPGSQMDVRSLNIKDPDRRVRDRISKLQPDEIGYIKVNTLQQDGVALMHETVGTVLEVKLAKPILPGESTTFDMTFDAQVPLQIRRSGRDNAEGVAFSMTQWYPKMAEYDFQGWHTPPYIAREFHGVWGDFDVKVKIDKDYVLGGTGYLQNPQEIGHNYEDITKPVTLPDSNKLTWHFKAPNVHDFTWAADKDYNHDVVLMKNGIKLHFLYKKNMEGEFLKNWKDLQSKTVELMIYYSTNVGQYPYKQYSVIQGGDGGMEYAMCTLITGKRKFGSLFGVTAHEMAHTWFQFLLASNESLHPWMDEGFTTYISNKASNEILKSKKENPHEGSYRGYNYVVATGEEESLSTHADRYNTNRAYSIGSYSKGNIFLSQLEYVIGEENVAKGLKKYFTDFSFKHPAPNDIQRTMEKVSGIHLGWYLNEWTETTHTIDYGVKAVDNKTITLERLGKMPMPLDVKVEYTDGSNAEFNIALEMMRGNKPTTATILKDWGWAYPTYTFSVAKQVKKVTIETKGKMADVNPENNVLVAE
ncbi:M1 family metallopeptidase [Polaribacter sp.]|nr:M1 family metallopeptidase [Polaribacter sp.]